MRATRWSRFRFFAVPLILAVGAPLIAGTEASAQGEKVSGYLDGLSHPSAAVRRAAVEKLGALGAWEAVEPLIPLLADPDEGVRGAVRDALEQIGVGAVSALLTAIAAPDPVKRAGAANVLGRFGEMNDERLTRALTHALTDSEATVRTEAASALGTVGDDSVFEPLKQALRDTNLRVQVAAAASLAERGEAAGLSVLLKAATSPDPDVRRMVVGPLGKFPTPAAVQALQDLTSDTDPGIRSEAYFGLIGSDAPATKLLALRGLKDNAWEVRRNVAHALGVLQVVGAADSLLETLQTDKSDGVRGAAGIALANLGDRRAVAPLIAMLSSSGETVRSCAASALGTLEAKEAVKPLTSLLDDESPSVRRSARMALVRILENCPDCPK